MIKSSKSHVNSSVFVHFIEESMFKSRAKYGNYINLIN